MTEPQSLAISKAALRSELKAVRAAFVAGLTAAEHFLFEAMLATRIAEHLAGVDRIASYVAFGSEINPAQLRHGAVLLPRVAGPRLPLTFHDANAAPLVRSRFGVAEPPAGLPNLDPEVVLVPLLGADRRGNRIGYGGGYYDRTLNGLRRRCRTVAIGCAWDCQLLEGIAADNWDEPLDAIATPTQFLQIAAR